MFETSDFKNKIKQYSPLLQDNKMHARIGDIDFVAKETTYHAICRTIRLEQIRLKQARSYKPKTNLATTNEGQHMTKHFNSIKVEDTKERYEVFFMNDLNKQYITS